MAKCGMTSSYTGPVLPQMWDDGARQVWDDDGPELAQSRSKVGPKLVQSWSKLLGKKVLSDKKTTSKAKTLKLKLQNFLKDILFLTNLPLKAFFLSKCPKC